MFSSKRVPCRRYWIILLADIRLITDPVLHKLCCEAFDAAHDRPMRERKIAFSRHPDEVLKAEPVTQLPTSAENDDFAIEMTVVCTGAHGNPNL
jgi:hypothetical protein